MMITTGLDNLAEWLKQIRKQRGLTLSELSKLCGVSVSFLSDLERGRTVPSLKTLNAIASAYEGTVTIQFTFDYEIPVDHYRLIEIKEIKTIIERLKSLASDNSA